MNTNRVQLFFILVIFISACGTESDPDPIEWKGSWKEMGFLGESISAVEAFDELLFVSGSGQIFRQNLAENVINWKGVGVEFDPEIAEVSDLLYSEFGFYSVIRSLPGINDLPLDFKTLYISTDQGDSWSHIEISNMERRVRPHVMVELAVCCNHILYGLSGFLYKSEDEGATWKILDHRGAPRFLYLSPDHPNQIWLGGQTNILTPHIEMSDDYGENWQSLNDKITDNPLNEGRVYSVIISPNDEKMVLSGLSGRVRKSVDGGKSWETVLGGYSILTFANSTVHSDRVFASGISPQGVLFVAVSDNYGDSWQIEQYPESPDEMYVNDMAVTTFEGEEVVYLGTNRGVYGFRLL